MLRALDMSDLSSKLLKMIIIFVAGDRRHLKLGWTIDHSKSQPAEAKLFLKWAWSRHVMHFKAANMHTSGINEARSVKFLRQVGYI